LIFLSTWLIKTSTGLFQ